MAQEYWAIPTGGSGPPPTEWTRITVGNTTSGANYTLGGLTDTSTTSGTITLDSITKTIKDNYLLTLESNLLYGKSPLYDYMTTKKERKMTPIEEARAEREKTRINALMDEYTEADFGALDTGTVIQFDWTPEDSDKTYQYAAIYADNRRWYLTGARAPQGLKTTELEDWLIEKDIAPGDIAILSV